MSVDVGHAGWPVARRRGRHAAPRRSPKPFVLAAILLSGIWASALVVDHAPDIAVGVRPVMTNAVTVAAERPVAGHLTVRDVWLHGVDLDGIAPDAPVGLAFAYEGARVGTTLRAAWTVDGNQFRSLRILLPSSHGAPTVTLVPPAGSPWPAGEHRIVLSTGVTPLGEVRFRVA